MPVNNTAAVAIIPASTHSIRLAKLLPAAADCPDNIIVYGRNRPTLQRAGIKASTVPESW